MASSDLASLALLLVVAGLTLLATSFRLSWLARAHRQRMDRLLALTGSAEDPLDLPAQAWPALAEAGWAGLRWQGRWFGSEVQGTQGRCPLGTGRSSSQKNTFRLSSGDDVHLEIQLFAGSLHAEAQMFAENLARVFILLLETRLRNRTEALAAAMAQRAQVSLYLQHDMRNLAQWVTWVTTDLADCNDETALLALAHRLQGNAPLAHGRATRLMTALGRDQYLKMEGHALASELDIRTALLEAAQLAGIPLQVSGDGQACISPAPLARTLDNLFTNVASNWRQQPELPPLEITITRACPLAAGVCCVEVSFTTPSPAGLPPPAQPERLFEPFASGRPGGLGLGLYQARRSLCEAGGDLRAKLTGQGLHFVLSLPTPACKKN